MESQPVSNGSKWIRRRFEFFSPTSSFVPSRGRCELPGGQ
jgi:hypothetical protein